MKRNSSKPKRKTAGFTLVELVVVIAVLAILAGVGVVAYNGYITYANKGVDRQLVGEIMHAAELANYDDPSLFKNGATILITNPGLHSTPAVETALGRALGDLNTIKLSYDGWSKPQMSDPSAIIGKLKDVSGKISGAVGDYLDSLDEEGATSYVGHSAELFDEVKKYIEAANGKGVSIPGVTVDPARTDYLSSVITYSDTYKEAIKDAWERGIGFATPDKVDPSGTVLEKGSGLAGAQGNQRMAVRLARNQAFAFYAQSHSAYDPATMKTALDQCKSDFGNCYCDASYLSGAAWGTIKADYLKGPAKQDAQAFLGIMQTVNQFEGDVTDEGLLSQASAFTNTLDAVLAGADLDTIASLSSSYGDSAVLSIGVFQNKDGDLTFTFSDDEINPRKENSTESGGSEAAGTPSCNETHHTALTINKVLTNIRIKNGTNALTPQGTAAAEQPIEICSINSLGCTITVDTSTVTNCTVTLNCSDGSVTLSGDAASGFTLTPGTHSGTATLTISGTISGTVKTATYTVNVH